MYNAPYGDTQQLNLDWFIKRWKEFYAEWEAAEADIDGALDAEVQKVENAMQDLYAARDAAAASASAAAQSANSASTSAATASNAATAAAGSATLANSKAAAAGLSEANAAQSANSASNSASAAAASATQANASNTNAAASAQAAAGSASAAAGSASAAATSETNAAASAQEAENVLDSIPEDYSALSNAVSTLQPPATNADIGKALIVKTVAGGKASEYEFGEAGGGSQIIPTEECLWKELFNKDYTFSGVNSRSGYVRGNHIYCTASASTTTPVGLPIHGTLAGAIQRYLYPAINLTEADFIDIPPRMNDFSIEIMFANDWEQNPDSGRGMKISLFTYQNGEVVPVYDSGKFLYNYGKSITQPNILTRFPIFRETRKIYFLFSSANQSANQIYDFRFILKSSINPTAQEIIARYNEYDFKATRAYSTNEIVQIGSALYRVTTPIASGADIIANTNVSRIYVSDVLTAFYNS